jgi:site-specific recombinase XerD
MNIKVEGEDFMLKLKPGKENTCILECPYRPDWIKMIKSIPGACWEGDRKHWILPCSPENTKKLINFFGSRLIIDPLFYLNPLKLELKIRKYSPKTIKSYLYYNSQLLKFTEKNPDEIQNKDVKNFLLSLVEEKSVKAATVNLAINALKFFYGKILNKEFVFEIIRPKKDRTLPKILSRAEIEKILAVTGNLKHKLLLMLTYSAGLRVSEVIHLKISDIDPERKTIHIRSAKGRKDRYTLLANRAENLLNQILDLRKEDRFIFISNTTKTRLSIRTAQKIFENAVHKAKIFKHTSIHSLRHSFATHLMESGVHIRAIQKLLGHKSSKTTERYTHVAQTSLFQIKNPLD